MRLLDIIPVNNGIAPILKEDRSHSDIPVALMEDKRIDWRKFGNYLNEQVNTNKPNTSKKTSAAVERLVMNKTPNAIAGNNGYFNLADLSGSYGEEYTDQSIICEDNSPTVYGKQLCTVAKYWLEKKVRETGANKGTYVEQFEKSYYGSVQSQPWCAVFVWFCNDEASKLLGIPNKFPGGSKIWGNAKATLEASKLLYVVNKVVAPGSCLFRNSDGGYNHMGIVINLKQQTFYTIEGNVKLVDGSEGIGLWEYDIADISNPAYGIQFIHTELTTVPAKEPVEYFGYYPCKEQEKPEELPNCITKAGNEYYYNYNGVQLLAKKDDKGNWSAFYEGYWVLIDNCSLQVETGTKGETTPEEQAKKDKEIEEKEKEDFIKKLEEQWKKIELEIQDKQKQTEAKTKLCETVFLSVPPLDAVPHFTVLKNPVVVDDIFSTKNSGKSTAEIFGAALNYYGKNKNPQEYTTFGIFQDKAGNTIYFIDGSKAKSVTLIDKDYIFPNAGYKNPEFTTEIENKLLSYNTFFVEGPVSLSLTANDKAWMSHKNSTKYNEVLKSLQTIIENEKHSSKPDDVKFIYRPAGWGIDHVNLMRLLEEIENYSLNKKQPFSKPIVFYVPVPKPPVSIWTKLIEDAAKLISIAMTFIPIPGLSEGTKLLFNSTMSNLVKLAKGEKIDYMQLAASLAQVAEFIAPETVKGFNKEYITPAKEAVNKIVGQGKELYADAAAYLGITSTEVRNIYQQYIGNSVDSIGLLAKNYGEGFNDIVKKLQNTSNMFMMNQVNKWIGGGELERQLNNALAISQVPIFQDLLIIGASETVLPAVPGIQQLSSILLGSKSIQGEYDKLSSKAIDVRAALIKSAFGYIPDSSLFEQWTVSSLTEKAMNVVAEKFIMPPSIPKEKQICYKYEIERRTGKEVIPTCDEGWEYDVTMRKCVQKGKIYVPEIPDTTKPKVPETPTVPKVPTVPDIKVEIKPELPNCIEETNGKFTFNYNGTKLEARKVDNGLWFAYYNRYWSPIVNCELWYCYRLTEDGLVWVYKSNYLKAAYENGQFIVYYNNNWIPVKNCELKPETPNIPVVPETPNIPVVPETPKIPVIPLLPEVPSTTKEGCECVDKYHAQLIQLINKINSETKQCEDITAYKNQIETLKNAVANYELLVKNLSEKINNQSITYNDFKNEFNKYNTVINQLNEKLSEIQTGSNDYLIQIEKLKETIREKEQKIIELETNKDGSIYQESHEYEANELKKEIEAYKKELEEKNKLLREKELKPELPRLPDEHIPGGELPEPEIPHREIPKSKKPGEPCGCEKDYPKMVVQRKKIIYQYPKDDCGEYCCDGNNEFL